MKRIAVFKGPGLNFKGSFFLISFFVLFSSSNVKNSFDSYITGPTEVTTGAQEYYEANFSTNPDPFSTIFWIVTGGTIISQNTNPNNGTIYCIVEWTQSGDAHLSVHEDFYYMNAYIDIRITDPCYQANAGNDVTICSGNSTTIGTTAVSGYTYAWFPATGLNNPSIAQPTANPTQTTTYTLTMNLPNLLNNGDFENGFTGFSTDYNTYPNGDGLCSLSGPYGSLTVNTNPHSVYYLWCVKADHSPIGNKMLIVDASCGSNKRVWYETISVSANTNYVFSGWAGANGYQSFTSGEPVLRVRINGVNVIQNFSVPLGPTCDSWLNFSAAWNSGSSTTALIEIYDDNLEAGDNDFSLDDLFFANCAQTTDNVTVTVGASTPTISPAGPITYYNEYESMTNVVLTSTPAPSYQWYKNNVAISGATSQTYALRYQGINPATDYYKVVTSCGTSNTVTFNYIGCNEVTDYPVTLPGNYGCVNSFPVTLYAPNLGTGTTYSWWTNSPSTYSFSNFSGNTCQMSATAYSTEGVYTKSSRNGQETYMYYVVVGNAGCRISNPSYTNRSSININSISNNEEKTALFPNPAKSFVIIKSSSLINKVEIYNESGVLIKNMKGNNTKSMNLNIEKIASGTYICKVYGGKKSEALKMIVLRN